MRKRLGWRHPKKRQRDHREKHHCDDGRDGARSDLGLFSSGICAHVVPQSAALFTRTGPSLRSRRRERRQNPIHFPSHDRGGSLVHVRDIDPAQLASVIVGLEPLFWIRKRATCLKN